jgi:hypothetical protein
LVRARVIRSWRGKSPFGNLSSGYYPHRPYVGDLAYGWSKVNFVHGAYISDLAHLWGRVKVAFAHCAFSLAAGPDDGKGVFTVDGRVVLDRDNVNLRPCRGFDSAFSFFTRGSRRVRGETDLSKFRLLFDQNCTWWRDFHWVLMLSYFNCDMGIESIRS